MNITNAATPYAASFGALPNETAYSNPAGFIMRESKSMTTIEALQSVFENGIKQVKAFTPTAGGAGTAGYAMVPIYLDPRIVDRTRKWTPLVELFPRVTNYGMTADYNIITSKGGAFTAGLDAALNETNTTYDRASVDIKFLYSVGRVLGQTQAAVPPYMLAGFQPAGGTSTGPFGDVGATNALQQEILVKTREIKELEESLLVRGNATTSVFGGPDGTEFSGFMVLVSTTNTVAKGTTAIALDDVTTAIQYAFDDGGRPNIGVCDSSTFSDLIKLLTAKIGYLQPVQQVMWGFSAIMLNTQVGQIPVIQSQFMLTTTAYKAIYFLDMSVIELRVLQDLTYEPLAKTNDSEKFMLKMYECLVVKAPTFCSSVTGIA